MDEREIKMVNVMTAEKFSLEVERRYVELRGELTLLDIASSYLEELGIDPEDGKPLISKSLLDKLYDEALLLNLLKEKSNTIKLL